MVSAADGSASAKIQPTGSSVSTTSAANRPAVLVARTDTGGGSVGSSFRRRPRIVSRSASSSTARITSGRTCTQNPNSGSRMATTRTGSSTLVSSREGRRRPTPPGATTCTGPDRSTPCARTISHSCQRPGRSSMVAVSTVIVKPPLRDVGVAEPRPLVRFGAEHLPHEAIDLLAGVDPDQPRTELWHDPGEVEPPDAGPAIDGQQLPDPARPPNAGGQGGLAVAQLQHFGRKPFRVGQRCGPGEDPAVDDLRLRQARVVPSVVDRTLQLGPITVCGPPQAELPVEPDMGPDIVVGGGQAPLGRSAQPLPVRRAGPLGCVGQVAQLAVDQPTEPSSRGFRVGVVVDELPGRFQPAQSGVQLIDVGRSGARSAGTGSVAAYAAHQSAGSRTARRAAWH